MVVVTPYFPSQQEGDVGQAAATLAYDPDQDSWRRLDDPPANYGVFGPGTGEQPLFWQSEETPRGADWLLDPESGSWSRLPDDPFPSTFDRSYTWDGEALVFTALLSSGVDDEAEDVYRMARLDPGTREWSVLDPTPVGFGNANWFVTDGSLVNPSQPEPGTAASPGGIMDLATGEWRAAPRPDSVDGDQLTCELPRIGLAGAWIAGGGGALVSVHPDTSIFVASCAPLHAPQVGVWTGDEFIVYGGVDPSFKRNLTIGLRWTPPAPG
jgi:hypothetical protein